MLPKLALHLQPERGWINDPNGLCYFQGKYHAFFQHNPKAPVWDTMHWGHAVSEDLLHWEELPIALYPDQPYESGQGCFSGSAVEKDGRLYLFYTAVDSNLAQTQCLAWTDDGQHFTKYPGNPILPHRPGQQGLPGPQGVPLEGRHLPHGLRRGQGGIRRGGAVPLSGFAPLGLCGPSV